MLDVNDVSVKQQEPLQPDMGGKVADMSNLETSEAKNIALSMCSAPKNINELAIGLDTMEKEDDMSTLAHSGVNENVLRTYTTTKGNNVLVTERDLNHNMVDLGPTTYPSPFALGSNRNKRLNKAIPFSAI
ncbi:hypothetical protein V6N12_010546 [Hibiscus sabdariffa]|uniref:Uncharacterized protein n=1 Tax=Hibiscus sabdariffa TaxID=183260 RepID=A0ABR2EKE4_9ROSI